MPEITRINVPLKEKGDNLTHDEFNAVASTADALAAEAIPLEGSTEPTVRLLAGISSGSLFVINFNAG